MKIIKFEAYGIVDWKKKAIKRKFVLASIKG